MRKDRVFQALLLKIWRDALQVRCSNATCRGASTHHQNSFCCHVVHMRLNLPPVEHWTEFAERLIRKADRVSHQNQPRGNQDCPMAVKCTLQGQAGRQAGRQDGLVGCKGTKQISLCRQQTDRCGRAYYSRDAELPKGAVDHPYLRVDGVLRHPALRRVAPPARVDDLQLRKFDDLMTAKRFATAIVVGPPGVTGPRLGETRGTRETRGRQTHKRQMHETGAQRSVEVRVLGKPKENCLSVCLPPACLPVCLPACLPALHLPIGQSSARMLVNHLAVRRSMVYLTPCRSSTRPSLICLFPTLHLFVHKIHPFAVFVCQVLPGMGLNQR
jgi:hypothetical protein